MAKKKGNNYIIDTENNIAKVEITKETYIENRAFYGDTLSSNVMLDEGKITDQDITILRCPESLPENRKKEIIELKKRKENNVAIKSIEDKIDESKKKMEEVQKKIMPLEEELNQVNYWIYYMGKNGFKTYLANKAVSVLEGTVNSYLNKFKSDLSVNINGFKILKDGSVREKIESFVLESGMNPKLFMAMSGGERGRIKLAGILAIQHLINMSLNGNGLNILILDESLSGIDSEGTMEFVNILENIGSTILLITQNIEDSKIFKNVLTVEKKNGVSRYIN